MSQPADRFFDSPAEQLAHIVLAAELLHDAVVRRQNNPTHLVADFHGHWPIFLRLFKEIKHVDQEHDEGKLPPNTANREVREKLREALLLVEHSILQLVRNDLHSFFITNEHAEAANIQKVANTARREALVREQAAIGKSYGTLEELFHDTKAERERDVTDAKHWVAPVVGMGILVARLMRVEQVCNEARAPSRDHHEKGRLMVKYKKDCVVMSVGRDSHVLGSGFNRITSRKACFHAL